MNRIKLIDPLKILSLGVLLGMFIPAFSTQHAVLSESGTFPIVLEAENARLYGNLKVKPLDGSVINGLSGGKYIGDFDLSAKSYLQITDIEIPEEGTYELRVFSMGSGRALSIKVNQYAKSVIITKDSPDWNNAPPSMVSTLIYMDKGKNKITFGLHNDNGPNLDKFEIHTTSQAIPKPKIENLAFVSDHTDEAEITAEHTNETVSYLTDNSEFTVYRAPGVHSTQIVAKCKQLVSLTGYLLSSGPDAADDVTKWTLESSVDNTVWKKITPNTSTDLSGACLFTINRTSGSIAANAAQYYRLTANGSADVNVGEWQLFGVPYLANTDGKSFPQDITEGVNLESNVSGYPEGSSNEKFHNLFNRKLTNKYFASKAKEFYVEIDLGKKYQLDSYTLTSADAYPDRDPSRWTLNGYNEELGWVELDRRVDFSFPSRYASMRFDMNDKTGFTKFLLDVENNNGSSDTQLLKWQLFGKECDNETSIETTKSDDTREYTIYPGQGKIDIFSHTDVSSIFGIYNVSGVLVSKGVLSEIKEDIALSQGIYIVSIHNNVKNYLEKVIVR